VEDERQETVHRAFATCEMEYSHFLWKEKNNSSTSQDKRQYHLSNFIAMTGHVIARAVRKSVLLINLSIDCVDSNVFIRKNGNQSLGQHVLLVVLDCKVKEENFVENGLILVDSLFKSHKLWVHFPPFYLKGKNKERLVLFIYVMC